jgi:hypothetical protein
MREVFAFTSTIFISLILIALIGKRAKLDKKPSRYERSPDVTNDWQKLDRGIDPTK